MKRILALIVIIVSTPLLYCQNNQWFNYFAPAAISDIVPEGDTIWAGTSNGLMKVNAVTGETEFLQKWNSGLPSNEVYSVAVDSQGVKWIGTSEGLARFDGKNWTVYNNINTIISFNCIFEVTIDSHGYKWIGTSGGGMYRFDGNKNWIVFDDANAGIDRYIYSIAIDPQGVKWIGTSSTFTKFDDKTFSKYHSLNSGMPGAGQRFVAIDKKGNKWICTSENGLVKYDGSNWIVFTNSNSKLPSIKVTSVAFDEKGNKWIGTYGGGLAKYNDTTWTLYNSSGIPQSAMWINSVALDKYGNKWLGTNDALIKYDGKTFTSFRSSNSGLPGNLIRRITQDYKGNKWLSAGKPFENDRLVKYDGSSWTVYNSDLISQKINSITVDRKNNKWLGLNGGGLLKFTDTSWTSFTTANSQIKSNMIYNVAVDRKGDKWLATDNGLVHYNDTTWTVYNTSNSKLPVNTVFCVLIDKQDRKWAGTYGGGLACLDGTVWTVYNPVNSGLKDDTFQFISLDSLGNIWLSQYNTPYLTKFDGSKFVSYEFFSLMFPVSGEASSIASDKNGEVWLSTLGGGIIKCADGKLTVYNSSNSSLKDNVVYNIFVDTSGVKWIGAGSSGVFLLNEKGILSTDVKTGDSGHPEEYALMQNFPNPFNPSTKIEFTLKSSSYVTLKVYDVLGKEVAVLAEGTMTAGVHVVNFNAGFLSSGLYIYRLQSGSFSEVKKMLLLR